MCLAPRWGPSPTSCSTSTLPQLASTSCLVCGLVVVGTGVCGLGCVTPWVMVESRHHMAGHRAGLRAEMQGKGLT
jgi:hypothetical protein